MNDDLKPSVRPVRECDICGRRGTVGFKKGHKPSKYICISRRACSQRRAKARRWQAVANEAMLTALEDSVISTWPKDQPRTFHLRTTGIKAMFYDGTPASIDAICRWLNANYGAEGPVIDYITTDGGKTVVDVILWTPDGDAEVKPNTWVTENVHGQHFTVNDEAFKRNYAPDV